MKILDLSLFVTLLVGNVMVMSIWRWLFITPFARLWRWLRSGKSAVHADPCDRNQQHGQLAF